MEDKKESIIFGLETVKEAMVKAKHFDVAGVISNTLKYIRSCDIKPEGYARKNKELIETIEVLTDQADTKKNNLLNFHSANILQGKLNRGSTLDNKTIVDQSINLAKLMIDKLKDEEE